nr:hypothetical protein [Candidatus Sigynarchaeum springense]
MTNRPDIAALDSWIYLAASYSNGTAFLQKRNGLNGVRSWEYRFGNGTSRRKIALTSSGIFIITDREIFDFTASGSVVWKKATRTIFGGNFINGWDIEIIDGFIYIVSCEVSSLITYFAKLYLSGDVDWTRTRSSLVAPHITYTNGTICLVGLSDEVSSSLFLSLVKYNTTGSFLDRYLVDSEEVAYEFFLHDVFIFDGIIYISYYDTQVAIGWGMSRLCG